MFGMKQEPITCTKEAIFSKSSLRLFFHEALRLFTEVQVNSSGLLPSLEEARKYPPLVSNTKVNNCFSIITKPVSSQQQKMHFIKTQLKGDYSHAHHVVLHTSRVANQNI